MNKTIYSIILAVLFTACGESVSELEQFKIDKGDLLKEITELQGEIRTIDDEIVKLDTVVKDNRIAVSVKVLEKTNFISYVEVHGVVQSNQTVNIVPEMSGIIRRITVREGQKVRKGQVLAYLNTDLISKQIQELNKSLELATDIFKKQKNMFEQNVGTEIQYLQAKNRKEAIELSLKTTKTQRSKGVITSPVSGKVDHIYPNTGEMAMPGVPFARIVNTADVYVNSDVSEALYNKVNQKDKVVLRLLNGEKKTVTSKIIYKGNYINPANRTFKIHSELKGLGDFPPNMLVAVKIIDTDLKDVYTVPRLLIQTDSKGNYVYEIVKKEGKDIAQKLHVKVIQSYEGKTVIESTEITATTKIVNHGYKGLDVGEEVKITTK